MRRIPAILLLIPSSCSLRPEVASPDATQTLRSEVEALSAEVRNTSTQVVNEVWPWLASQIGVSLASLVIPILLLLLGYFLIRRWITANSYLNQKPLYEKRKNGGC